ncbi:MAG: 2-phospho-L-lactate transferase CofD family protein, partial [Cyanobacteria bacterium J06626_18]
YICNVMTEPGETQGYKVSDHIRAIDRACGTPLFDAVLVQRRPPSPASQERYARVGAESVLLDRDTVIASGRRIVIANVMEEQPNGTLRHHPQRLAKVLMRWYSRTQGLR